MVGYVCMAGLHLEKMSRGRVGGWGRTRLVWFSRRQPNFQGGGGGAKIWQAPKWNTYNTCRPRTIWVYYLSSHVSNPFPPFLSIQSDAAVVVIQQQPQAVVTTHVTQAYGDFGTGALIFAIFVTFCIFSGGCWLSLICSIIAIVFAINVSHHLTAKYRSNQYRVLVGYILPQSDSLTVW